jgi:Ca2+-binding RTX toxin-like protein
MGTTDMAKIKYTDSLGDLGTLRFQYTPDEMHTDMDASGGEKAVYIDDNGGEKIILKGENFAYLDGDLLKGSVDKIIFQDSEGHTTAMISGVDFKAKQLDNLLTEGFDLHNFLDKAMSGKDLFKGSGNQDLAWAGDGNDRIKAFGGNDSVNGEAGNDIMTGGSGSDHFFFLLDDEGGKDVVTDFDAKGGGDNQDYIAAQFDDVLSIKQVGDDVVLNFGDGNTLTLLDTDKSNISEADFHMPI